MIFLFIFFYIYNIYKLYIGVTLNKVTSSFKKKHSLILKYIFIDLNFQNRLNVLYKYRLGNLIA